MANWHGEVAQTQGAKKSTLWLIGLKENAKDISERYINDSTWKGIIQIVENVGIVKNVDKELIQSNMQSIPS